MDAAAASAVTRLHLRYAGTDTALPVTWDCGRRRRAGRVRSPRTRRNSASSRPTSRWTVEAVEVEDHRSPPRDRRGGRVPRGRPAKPKATRACRSSARMPGSRPPSIQREALSPGDRVKGPALIIEANQTIVRGNPAGPHELDGPRRHRDAAARAYGADVSRGHGRGPIRSCWRSSTTSS